MSKHKHLIFNDRTVIQISLDDRKSFKEIGRILGRDCSTISKEVRNHIVYERTGGYGHAFNDCRFRYTCDTTGVCVTCKNQNRSCKFCGRCIAICPRYVKEICPDLANPPYVCNGCSRKQRCIRKIPIHIFPNMLLQIDRRWIATSIGHIHQQQIVSFPHFPVVLR